MKIYFAASIRGGRGDALLYQRMIAAIARRHTVLTEHVGDPHLERLAFEQQTDTQIYQADTALLRQADAVIAEATVPSAGVGYELAYAEAHGIPAHIFYDTGRGRLSAMLAGDAYFQLHPYQGSDGLMEELDVLLDGWDLAVIDIARNGGINHE